MQKDDPVDGLSREVTWRGAGTPGQGPHLESWLAAHPEERSVWEEEVALTRLLARLPDAAAPSNLAARVLEEIDEPDSQTQRHVMTSWLGWLRKLGWVPRLAGAAVLVVAGALGYHQYQFSKRAELARSVAEVTELAAVVPPAEVLQDFTVIRNMEAAALPDEDLLALLE